MSYDKRIAEKIIGKYILIGISYIDPQGKLESQQQLHIATWGNFVSSLW